MIWCDWGKDSKSCTAHSDKQVSVVIVPRELDLYKAKCSLHLSHFSHKLGVYNTVNVIFHIISGGGIAVGTVLLVGESFNNRLSLPYFTFIFSCRNINIVFI